MKLLDHLALRLVFLCLVLPVLVTAQDAPPIAQPPASAHRPRIGLALSGGGAMGLAEIGVIQWMEENHIPVDRIAGTSMGSIIGAMYATGMSPAEIETFAHRGALAHIPTSNFFGWLTMRIAGLIVHWV